jgi:hypothetical protein
VDNFYLGETAHRHTLVAKKASIRQRTAREAASEFQIKPLKK